VRQLHYDALGRSSWPASRRRRPSPAPFPRWSDRGGLPVRPGDLLLVADVASQAAVQDADQAIGERPKRLSVAVVGRAVPVIAAPRARRSGERGERPQRARVSFTLRIPWALRQGHDPSGSCDLGREALS